LSRDNVSITPLIKKRLTSKRRSGPARDDLALARDADKQPRIAESLSEVVMITAKVEKEKRITQQTPNRSWFEVAK